MTELSFQPEYHPELFAKIAAVIEEDIRPYMNSHGGDLEVVDFDQEKKLYVRLHGVCSGCAGSSMTLYYVVEEALEAEFPDENIQVIQVE